MPTLIFSDGKRQQVPYDKAAKIRQVLDGEEEPESPEQEEFIMRVSGIEWEKTVSNTDTGVQIDDEERAERRKKHKAIMSDKSLTGRQKFERTMELFRKSVDN